ncbi:MAG: hypothetical protein MUF64_10680 [Polyangiaceae bacterium]|nr:hypothetical protein [Polyangiaceae bacterium]
MGPVNGSASCSTGICIRSCSQGQQECNGACVDTKSDPKHCGACGQACAAAQNCSNGVCKVLCDLPSLSCDGACVSITSNPLHCGGCNKPCAVPENGQAVCNNGQCGIKCNNGTPCGSKCIDVSSDVNNCGGCGVLCDSTNGSPFCSGGQCTIQCDPGFDNCDNNLANGCETSLKVSPNCGACGVLCDSGQQCVDGQCQSKQGQ